MLPSTFTASTTVVPGTRKYIEFCKDIDTQEEMQETKKKIAYFKSFGIKLLIVQEHELKEFPELLEEKVDAFIYDS